MTETPLDVLVFGGPVHGMPIAEYAEALRDRLPDHRIHLAETPAEARAAVGAADVATGPSIDEALLDRADRLRLFAAASAGVGHLPMDALAARDVAVTTGSGVHAPNVAEYVLGSILAFARRLPEAWRRQRRREWRHFRAGELRGSTVTVVGLGAIGRAVVERLAGFGVSTVGVRYTPEKGGPTDEVLGFDDEPALQSALARTDYLVVACRLSAATRGLVGADEFEALPARAVVVNCSRGEVIDTDALVFALRYNSIEGAALDVTDPEPLPADHPLWGFENCLLTPHNAGHTPQYFDRLADVLAENVAHVEATGEYRNLQNQALPPDG